MYGKPQGNGRRRGSPRCLHHVTVDLLREAFSGAQAQCRTRGRRRDVAGLRGGPGGQSPGPARTGPSRQRTGHCPSGDGYIPKPDGKQRPLGIAALEDKIVQRAVVAVLNAIYEEDFLGFSYGFRPGRSQHDALDALAVGISSTPVNWILDADIRSFFDSVRPGLADSLPGASDRRRAHHPPGAQMAQGGCPGRRRLERQ